jgi:hypothetical protein
MLFEIYFVKKVLSILGVEEVKLHEEILDFLRPQDNVKELGVQDNWEIGISMLTPQSLNFMSTMSVPIYFQGIVV